MEINITTVSGDQLAAPIYVFLHTIKSRSLVCTIILVVAIQKISKNVISTVNITMISTFVCVKLYSYWCYHITHQ